MSEESLVKNQSKDEDKSSTREVSVKDILHEMQQIPREYWYNLLQIIKLYRESVILKIELPANTEDITKETDRLTQQHHALSELTKQWIEEGDEQEQTETWEYLRQNLDKNRISI